MLPFLLTADPESPLQGCFAMHMAHGSGIFVFVAGVVFPLKVFSCFPCKPSKAIKIMFCARMNCFMAGNLPKVSLHFSLSSPVIEQ